MFVTRTSTGALGTTIAHGAPEATPDGGPVPMVLTALTLKK